MRRSWVLARKELSAYFGTPMALIFVGAFLVITLLAFFWVEAFFARNVATVRPLFRWMPVLLLFLLATLTMRQWSEEQRSGTLEVLLTLPIRRVELVFGKFLAVMILVALALGLTLFVPITVSILGPLDWGPVIGGYLAALLMAAAYAAIGLFVSSRTDNQIVALIITVLLGGLFYVVGTSGVTGLTGDTLAQILRAIGTGSRFESIERGVIDLRDLVYYLSLTVIFLALNILSLDAKRWSRGSQTARYRWQIVLTVILVIANLLALNTWLFPLGGLRADLTKGREYSLSPVTKDLIADLPEPLLIRGYFSERTHPLLAPLVPTIRDLLREYEIAAGGKIKVEIVDPRDDEELEAEANQIYGIEASQFSVSDRYEASIINSYFDILIRYGDQHVTLGWQDLIAVESTARGDLEVRLRNLEYDLTRSIKKVVYGFQSLDSVFASIQDPILLSFFITPDTLPADLEDVPDTVEEVAQDLEEESGGKFVYQLIDLDAPGSPITRSTMVNEYGLYPMTTSFLSTDSFYFDLFLQVGDEAQRLYLASDLTEAELRADIEAALQRAAPGFLKTVGLWLPDLQPVQSIYGGTAQPISSWSLLQQQLGMDYTVRRVDLTSGRVAGDVDVLVIVAPQNMSDEELFAIDQYLMRGGAVVVAAGNYVLPAEMLYTLSVEAVSGGMRQMLSSYGIEVGQSMVFDTQNEPLSMQDYPPFVDVRSDGMDKESPIVSSLQAVTMNWVSPLTIDETKNAGREVTTLLQSTEDSWLWNQTNVQPDLNLYPKLGFAITGERQSWPLAVSIHGSFESYFKDQASPFEATEAVTGTVGGPLGTIGVSPDSTRLVVIGSAEFIDDAVLQVSMSLSQDRYLNNLQFMQNAVDWSAEDEDLLSIRARGTHTRLLEPLEKGEQALWEVLNYAFMFIALVVIGGVWTLRRRSEQPMDLVEAEGPESQAQPSGEGSGGSHE